MSYASDALIDVQKREIKQLKIENVKLKRLVHDMWQAISKDDKCSWNIDTNCCTSDECNVSCRYWYRMKDLGIEMTDV